MSESGIFDRLFVHFCRHPSFRDALKQSDPFMWRRLRDATMHRLPKEGQ